MDDAYIRVLRHGSTGLLMALSDDLPGFVMHAHNYEELEAKLPAAVTSFLTHTGRPPSGPVVIERDTVAGFESPAFFAKAQSEAAA